MTTKKQPTWKARAIAALKDSIAHWKRIETGKLKRGESVDSEWCACCREFLGTVGAVCSQCPINLRTRRSCCTTPYDDLTDVFPWDIGRAAEMKLMRTLRVQQIAHRERLYLEQTLRMVQSGRIKPTPR